ncbi:MAG: hypothetical protein KIT84_42800 [Labilithrix sp.]|nr:hypothetical protein [Labilithrix sp.]MCW5817808.1 hypothetical protein [Labilithrix sp.]
MSITPEMIKKVIGTPDLRGDDARRVLEIAALAVAADDKLAPEELDVIYALCRELRVPIASLDPVLALATREDRLEHLRAAASALASTVARHTAYKTTVLTAVADLAAADEEFEFDLDVQDALELDGAVADRLAGEVHRALTPDEP